MILNFLNSLLLSHLKKEFDNIFTRKYYVNFIQQDSKIIEKMELSEEPLKKLQTDLIRYAVQTKLLILSALRFKDLMRILL